MLQRRIDDQPTLSAEMVHEAEQILHRHIRQVGLKQTAQRDTILRTFLETREHLSVEQLHALVRKKDPKTITWCARHVAVRWSFFLLRWTSWRRRLAVSTTTCPLAIPSRFTVFAWTAARRIKTPK